MNPHFSHEISMFFKKINECIVGKNVYGIILHLIWRNKEFKNFRKLIFINLGVRAIHLKDLKNNCQILFEYLHYYAHSD